MSTNYISKSTNGLFMRMINSIEDIRKDKNLQKGGALSTSEGDNGFSSNSSVSTRIKLREFIRNSKEYFGRDFQLVNGRGEIVFSVFAGDRSLGGGFGFEDRENLNKLYEKVESLESIVQSFK